MSGGHSTRRCALSFVYQSHMSYWSKHAYVTATCAEFWDTIFGIIHDMVDHISVSSAGKWIIHPHRMMTSSNENIIRLTGLCAGNSPVTGEFLAQRPVTRSFDVFFDLRVNKQFSWINNRKAGDLRRYRAHYDVIVMLCPIAIIMHIVLKCLVLLWLSYQLTVTLLHMILYP